MIGSTPSTSNRSCEQVVARTFSGSPPSLDRFTLGLQNAAMPANERACSFRSK
jgi:hypothetical protein